MKEPRTVLCGGVQAPPGAASEADPIRLDRPGSGGNVNLSIFDISRKQVQLPDAVLDLLDLAAYVYCADQAVSRGGSGVRDMGAGWRRRFAFHVPVRQLDLWSSAEVLGALTDVLGFLSEDEYEFHFSKLTGTSRADQYFDFASQTATPTDAEEVLLFSGGLDSLAGALHEVVGRGRRAVLVSHRSSPRVDPRQKGLAARVAQLAVRGRAMHVPVWANKEEAITRDFTQRSRSFLFASLGVAVASVFGLRRIRFYENGVTSINLPISEQILGSRATRTTHPKTLLGFAKLFRVVLGHAFEVQNPFLWKTKADIVTVAARHGADLIRDTVSCSRERKRSSDKPHCGNCSQCIDRRFAILAAGCAQRDPGELYGTDLFSEGRESIKDRTMLQSYVGTAIDIDGMADEAFLRRFGGEISRVVKCVPGESADRAAGHVLELYKRHAHGIREVVEDQVRDHVSDLVSGTLSKDSLVVLSLQKQFRAEEAAKAAQPTWVRDRDLGTWTITYAEKSITPAHSVGLEYIGRLLARPNTDVGCVALRQLVAETSREPAAEASSRGRERGGQVDADEGLDNTGTAIPATDRTTIEECKERLLALVEERREAESSNDAVELARIDTEREKIAKYLKSVTGRRGKIRNVDRDERRARQSVGKAIERSISLIEKAHEALGRHLRNTVKINGVCVYEPDGTVVWRT
jgi:7-cyano-7-deazaguanine synthase in queuosine biosynthesis